MAGTRYKAVGVKVNGLLNAIDDSAAQFNPGFEVQDELGNKYRYVKNANASAAWVAGQVVKGKTADLVTDNGRFSYIDTVAGDEGLDYPVGIALNAVTAAQYGFIGVQGVFTADLTGTIAAEDQLILSATAKELAKFNVGQTFPNYFAKGYALEAGTDTTKEVYFDGD